MAQPRMSRATCPNEDQHTPHPEGYIANAEWAEQMLKTHRQVQCPWCGLWAIWVPRDPPPENEQIDQSEWHGWGIELNGQNVGDPLHIGPLPGRKGIALYLETNGGSVIEVLAYFRSKEHALMGLKAIDQITRTK